MDHEDGQPAETPSVGEESQVDDNVQTQDDQTDVNPSSAEPSDADSQDVKQSDDPASEVEDVNKEPESLFDAVSKAAKSPQEGKDQKQTEETSASETDESKDQQSGDPNQETDEEKELRELDGKPVPYVRFKEAIEQKNEFKEKVETLSQEVETLRPQAEGFNNFRNYMQERNVSGTDAVRALDIVGLINSDPQKALVELGQIYEDLGVSLGAFLPTDIQQRIDAGEMTEEAGKEYAIARTKARMSQQTIDTTQAQQTFQQNQAKEYNQAQIKSSVNAWDADKQKSDPTYKGEKRKLVQTYITAIVAKNGAPQTAEQYLAIANHAYTEASKVMQSAAPKRPAKTPGPASTGSPSQSTAAPKTMLEAVKLGASQSQ